MFRSFAGFLAAVLISCFAAPAATQPPAAAARGFDEALPPVDGRRVALVIGNSDYAAEGWLDLANARNDATHIAQVLGDPGRGRARFEVELLIDAPRARLIERLAEFARRAASADIALIYFSGHGFEFSLNNYIVPVDAPGRVDASNVDTYYVNIAQVVNAGATRGLSLFFLDACRNPGPVMDLGAGSSASGSRAALFGAINAPQAAVFYATTLGHVAYDSAPRGSALSPFAAAVARGMQAPGLDIPYMFSRVRDYVIRATQERDPTQIPQFAGSWSRPFFFMPPEEVAAAQTGAAAAPPRRLDIPLTTLATIDEPTLITRVLAEHSAGEMVRMAEAGDPLALYLVGYMFEFGVGVERSLPQARMWLERAAATGHPAGQLEYGYFLLQHGDDAGDRVRALDLYRRAAAQNYAKAMSHLGGALVAGLLGPVDRAEGIRLFRAASAAGHASATYNLALLAGFSENVAVLERLAAAGNVEGDAWLCELSASGLAVATPFARCLRAAREGYINAQGRLALMYAAGQGVAASASSARNWAYLALGRRDLDESVRGALEAMLARQEQGRTCG